jgi:hypothetical protein
MRGPGAFVKCSARSLEVSAITADALPSHFIDPFWVEVILMVKWKSIAARLAPAASLVALVVTAAAGKKWG